MPSTRWVQRLGKHDQWVEWLKPVSPPNWMNPETFEQLPDKILVREIRWRIRDPYHRVQQVTLVTTLLDPQRYPAAAIARLYRQRWQVEVDLRDLKTTLGMDVLKGHSVDVIRKEVQVFILVYNLVRLVMLKAAQQVETPVEQMSVPKCLTAMGQALLKTSELVIKGQEPDWTVLEDRLVAIIVTIHRRSKRKRLSRLAQGVRQLFTPSVEPTAASP